MRVRSCLLGGGLLLMAVGYAVGQEIPLPPDVPEPPAVREFIFSIEPPRIAADPEMTTATAALLDPAEMPLRLPTPGDALSSFGYVVATNKYLMRNFHPTPSTTPVNYGLDGIHLHRDPADTTPRPHFLFSTAVGFHDDTLGIEISDGDLLSDSGRVVMTNAQLLRNFKPMPPVAPLGLDAFCVMRIFRPISATMPPEIWFSTKVGFFDERLGIQITAGDLLSTAGRVVAPNRWLMRNFKPALPADGSPLPPHFGLDAVFVPKFNDRTDSAARPPEIWFSTDRGWYDEKLQRPITDGDLLSSEGRVVRTNWQLVRGFFPKLQPGQAPPVKNLGLDAIDVRLRRPDFNVDGAVDGSDFGHFAQCFNGAGNPIDNACADADLDDDNDVDGADYGAFAAEFTGTLSDE